MQYYVVGCYKEIKGFLRENLVHIGGNLKRTLWKEQSFDKMFKGLYTHIDFVTFHEQIKLNYTGKNPPAQ